MKESFCCKTRKDLSINCDAIESLCLEITNEKSKNIILNLTYRPRNGDVKEFEKHLNKILSINDILKKEVIVAGDFNMNLLDFEQNKKVQNFLNIMFGHSMMPVINKPTRVTKNTATAIDNIFINSVTTTKFKTGIIKSDISDHFPIFFVAGYNIHIKETKERFKEFLDIQATIECGFTLKRVRDMTGTYSQMHRTDKYSQHSSIIWPIWLNG